MTTIVVSPEALAEEEIDSRVITLQVYVDSEDWVGFFDQIQVYRSRTGSKGPYEELTAPQVEAAQLPAGTGPRPTTPVTGAGVALNGTTLKLRVGQKEDITASFVGADPMTFAVAAAQLVAQGRLKIDSWVDADGHFVVASTDVGTSALLEVLGGEAAPRLGLTATPPANLAFGHNARIALQAGKTQYSFQDVRSGQDYYYRLRFLNKSTGATSAYSPAFASTQVVGISQSNLVHGHLSLVDSAGRPLSGYAVQLHVEYNGTHIEGKVVAGGDVSKTTDAEGRVEFTLVRGQLFSLAIPGTSLNRQFISPVDPTVTSFDLLDPQHGTSQDMFKVAVPKLVVAERRSL